MTKENLPRVVHVEDEYTAVINVGFENGVKKGDKYLIYALGPEISDFETGESLGKLEIVKGKVNVEHIQEKMCTVRCYEKIEVAGRRKIIKKDVSGGLSAYLALAGGPTREEIEEGPELIEKKLDAELRDFARPI